MDIKIKNSLPNRNRFLFGGCVCWLHSLCSCYTVLSQNIHSLHDLPMEIRFLTPNECLRERRQRCACIWKMEKWFRKAAFVLHHITSNEASVSASVREKSKCLSRVTLLRTNVFCHWLPITIRSIKHPSASWSRSNVRLCLSLHYHHKQLPTHTLRDHTQTAITV